LLLVGAELKFTLPCGQFVCVVSYIARKKTIPKKKCLKQKKKKDRMKKMRFIYLLGGRGEALHLYGPVEDDDDEEDNLPGRHMQTRGSESKWESPKHADV